MAKTKNPGVGKGGSTPIKHGHKRNGYTSPEYRTWLGMKRRCYDAKYKDYPNWGGRGIRVCDRWLHDFSAFLADMGLRPTPEHQIDRKDPNLDYGPDNCRWVTAEVQGAENRRGLLLVEIDGLSFPSLAAACRHFGVNLATVHGRIKAGVPVGQALRHTARLKPRRDKITYLPKDHPRRVAYESNLNDFEG